MTPDDFIDSLCADPKPLSLTDRARIYMAEIRHGIMHDPQKMFSIAFFVMVGMVILVLAVFATFMRPASATLLGKCDTGVQYAIAPGDTLWRIANNKGVTVTDLVLWNDIPNPDLIHVGDILCVAPPLEDAPTFGAALGLTAPSQVQSANHCSRGPQPGAVALDQVIREAYPAFTVLGIYNCRPARGGSVHSTHSEGRAIDWGTDGCTVEAYDVASMLSKFPGVQRWLYCDREYRVDTGEREASASLASWHGYNPHGPPMAPAHIHLELSREAAATYTIDQWRSILAEATTPIPTLDDLGISEDFLVEG